MKTEVTEFCSNYTSVLRRLAGPLQNAISRMDRDADGTLRTCVAGLKDVHHRLDALVEKLEGQKAYLLIFGPLKSGKSTLMNAISGAYVSEVTAMPAYPALVYLGHGDSLEFTLVSYAGSKQTLRDGAELKRLMLERHQELADCIREQESQGIDFDPGIHAPHAIRRIDVRLPVRKLKEGSTILVDTPGLYSRMKFGYDLMTRTFRNSAACAVFVVKTDNLFLEQVFDEFNELLELFSRIFLVVNIDSRKLDLQPDGSLRPSIEGEDPEKIIEAFKSFSMTAPLRRALEEGRLRIYPIDLLMSASNSLTEGTTAAPAPADETAGVDGEGEPTVNPAAEATRRFDQFIADLTDYLNSSAYLAEFVKDSLNQGATLTEEIVRVSEGDALGAFRQQRAKIAASLREIKAKLATAGELEGFDLRGSFARMKEQVQRETSELEATWRERTFSELSQAIDQWMEDSESLQSLVQSRWSPILKKNHEQALAEISSRTALALKSGQGGADIPENRLRQLEDIGFSLDAVLPTRSERMANPASQPAREIRISDETIPVNRTFFDRILFRRQAAVRLKLFGPPDRLDREIAPKAKQKRLVPDGKEALKALAREQVDIQFGSVLKENLERVEREHIEPYCRCFSDKLLSIKNEFVKPLAQLEKQTAVNAALDEALNALRQQSVAASSSIKAMISRYVPPPPPEPEPAPALEEPGQPEETTQAAE
jgi:GTPase SAR1 family protein